MIKTNSQEVFKKYTGVFAISIKGVIGYELYNKGGIDGVQYYMNTNIFNHILFWNEVNALN